MVISLFYSIKIDSKVNISYFENSVVWRDIKILIVFIFMLIHIIALFEETLKYIIVFIFMLIHIFIYKNHWTNFL